MIHRAAILPPLFEISKHLLGSYPSSDDKACVVDVVTQESARFCSPSPLT